MSIQLDEHAYQRLIDGNIGELEIYMPKYSLEKKHIIEVLNWSVNEIYHKNSVDKDKITKIQLNEKQKEQLEYIQTANDLNQEMYEKHGDVAKFNYSTDGYCEIFSFGDTILWNSEDDDRIFIEEKNDYEPFKPFIFKKFNEYIDAIAKLIDFKIDMNL